MLLLLLLPLPLFAGGIATGGGLDGDEPLLDCCCCCELLGGGGPPVLEDWENRDPVGELYEL
jgi:hypothetical protein